MSEVPAHLVGILLDIGGGNAVKTPGWWRIDNRQHAEVDCVHDLEAQPWPLPAEAVLAAQAFHVVQRINPARWGFIAFMDEVWRLLKPGAEFRIVHPYGMSQGYLQDPAACNPCTEATWYYFDPEHRSGLWQVYQPLPWRITYLTWEHPGNVEVILGKR
jgi:hypothetical protein